MIISEIIGETTEYDKKLKVEYKKPKSWCKSISAFANSFGGFLVFGVSDSGEIIGLETPEKDAEVISETIKSRLDPIPEFELSFHCENEKTIIIVDVKKGEETPYYYTGDSVYEAFIRVGNESVRASSTELKRLVLRGKNISYDSQLSSHKAEDFAFSKLRARYKKWTGNSFDDKDLVSFGLANENGILTNAGVLFADDSPVYCSRLFCTRWNGLNKAGGSIDAFDDAELSGSLLYLLDEGEAFIKRNNKTMWRKTANSREEMPEYVERSYHEALINALAHRDYLINGSEVHIDIFDDRLEIYSPGGMPDGSLIQNRDPYKVPSTRRNPVVADTLSRLGYMERKGSGLEKIISSYENQHYFSDDKKPSLFSDPYQFTVVLPNLNYGINESNQDTTKVQPSYNQADNPYELDSLDIVIIQTITTNPNISQTEIAKAIQRPSGTVKARMNKMKKYGIIGREGTSQNGKWIIKK